MKVALDAMGGDNMPQAAVAGAVAAHREGIPVMLVGDLARLEPLLKEAGVELEVEHTTDFIRMEEHATDVRRRRESSVYKSVMLVKEGRAGAAVSMGHSGATMTAALFGLGRIPGVDRPAIVTVIPSDRGPVALLDAGANADCKPAWLQQFALMGSIFARTFLDRESPTVGLVSIGEEPEKGSELVLAAHPLLAATPGINFHGNVEGRDLLQGTVDVFVTDGFTGNVMLKLAEGEAKVLFKWIRSALTDGGVLAKLGGALVRPALRGLRDRMDPNKVGAQPLLGVNGNVLIGHGSANADAVHNALRAGHRAMEGQLTQKLTDALAELGKADPAA